MGNTPQTRPNPLRQENTGIRDRREITAILQSLKAGYLKADREGTIRDAGIALARLLRCTKKDLEGRAFEQFVHPDDRGAYEVYFGSLWKTSRAKPCELKLVNGAGETFAARIDCIPTGDPAALRLLVISDISDRKKAEEELQSVAGQNPSPVLRVSRDGIILYANDSSAGLLASWNCRLGSAVPDGIRRHIRSALENGAAIEAEVACGHVTYSFSIAPIASEGYVNLYGRDITDRKRMEVLLRKRNDFLNEVLESLTHPFCVIDAADHRILMANTATRLKNSPPVCCCSETSGCPMASLNRDFVKPLEEVKRTGKPVVIEQVHYDASGDRRNIEIHGYPIFDEQGRVIQMIEYCLDITPRKQMEEELRDLNATLEAKVAQRTEELQRRSRQLQELALELSQAEERERKRLGEILHEDLQQQLAAAKFQLSLVKSRIGHDSSLAANVVQIDDMLKSAIDTSRSLSHELSPPVLHHCDLTATLRWLANQFQTKHGLAVLVKSNGEVQLHSDELKAFFYRAAQELLFNVIKHARVKQGGIHVWRHREYVCMSVWDRGRGFDPQRLKETTGFGLLSIRERIEVLGGRMKIRSARGKGSTFLIMIPDAENPAAVPPFQMRSRQPAPTRVLPADDQKS